jgi:ribonuclease III
VYHIEERGPDHQKEFTATVVIGGQTLGSGVGRSKKEAEQQAAREAHARIGQGRGSEGNGDGTS